VSELVDRLNNAIMRGPIETPAWVINTMRDAAQRIALLEKVVEAVEKQYRQNIYFPINPYVQAAMEEAGYLGEKE